MSTPHLPTQPLLLNAPDGFESERLRLRTPRAGDGVLLHLAVAEALPQLREFLGHVPWVAQEPSVEASEVFCRVAAAQFLLRQDMPFLLFNKTSGQLVGVVGLHRFDWAVPRADVGYWLRTSAQGQGFAAEAVAAVTDYAFAWLKLARLELVTDAANAASQRVAERCGFALEATQAAAHRNPAGELRTLLRYVRLGAAAA